MPSRSDLTQIQREYLALIRLFRLLTGVSPSYREIARVMHRSVTLVYKTISVLVRKGYLVRAQYTERGFYPAEEDTWRYSIRDSSQDG